MKRTPLNRKSGSSLKRTPLKRGNSTLSANTPLNRNSEPMKRTPLKAKSTLTAKPRTVSSEEKDCREVVKNRSGGLCEICGKRSATDMAHRVGAGQNGKWMPANILHACRFCHSYNHDNPKNSYDHGWHLQSHLNPLKEPVLLVENGVKKWFLLDNKGLKLETNIEV